MAPRELAVRDCVTKRARVRFVEAGSGPALLLVHDYLSSYREYDRIIEGLAEVFHVIAPDLPGFGESEKPPAARFAYRAEDFAESMLDVLAAAGEARASVCGHGLGGAVALALAASHPHVVDKLVLVAPSVPGTRPVALSRVAPLPVVGPLLFKQVWGRGLFGAHFHNHVFGGQARTCAPVDELFSHFDSPQGRESAYATLLGMLDARALEARLPRVQAPAMVVWGRTDRTGPPTLGRKVARELRGARCEIVEAGHSPAEEAPEAVTRIVTRFVRGTGSERAA